MLIAVKILLTVADSLTPNANTPSREMSQLTHTTFDTADCKQRSAKTRQGETSRPLTWQNQNQAHGKEIGVRSQAAGVHGYSIFKEI